MLDVLVRSEGVAAVAAFVAVVLVAGDDLLRGQDCGVVAGEDPLALDSLGSGVCPAGAALALVLDGRHNTLLFAPIEVGRSLGGVEAGGGDFSVGLGERRQVVQVSLELLGGHVSELGDAEGGTADLVEAVGLLHVDGEDVEASLLLVIALVGLAVGLLEVRERVGVLSRVVGGAGRGGGDSSCDDKARHSVESGGGGGVPGRRTKETDVEENLIELFRTTQACFRTFVVHPSVRAHERTCMSA